MRGEHYVIRCDSGKVIGSAPHARGTLERLAGAVMADRFSPACAGNTEAPDPCPGPTAVQPRMRGEHLQAHLWAVDRNGSAPHARGTPGPVRPSFVSTRFSPACAGNTPATAATSRRATVQPRMRGGTQERRLPVLVIRRFSPACAGNTMAGRKSGDRATVQPRMRGEHTIVSPSAVFLVGSAPHARGTRQRAGSRLQPDRFSPACAGNT